MFQPGALSQRIQAVIHGAVGALPAALRNHPAARPNAAAVDRLTTLMTAWDGGAGLDQANFAARFFDREADDPIVAKLRDAAGQASDAKSHDDLRQASGSLADAQKFVGMDRWHRFLADARNLLTDHKVIGGAIAAAGVAGARANSEPGSAIGDTTGSARSTQRVRPISASSDVVKNDERTSLVTPVNYFTNEVNNSTANALGMSRNQLRGAIHSLKKANGLGGADNVIIHIPSGDVYFGPDFIGNLNDE